MSTAFDSINHQILLDKLQDIGASVSILEWFRSYLTLRYQAVRINTTPSDKLPNISGVPQGSILGPLLFSIYVIDLPSIPENCLPQCYVDDTKLHLLHPEKTKLVVFGRRQMKAKVNDFRLSLLEKELEPVTVARDLGVMLDANLHR